MDCRCPHPHHSSFRGTNYGALWHPRPTSLLRMEFAKRKVIWPHPSARGGSHSVFAESWKPVSHPGDAREASGVAEAAVANAGYYADLRTWLLVRGQNAFGVSRSIVRLLELHQSPAG